MSPMRALPNRAREAEAKMHLDIYTIVFFVIAVAIFVRLWGVLGQKTGAERPPLMPPRDDRDDGTAGNDNVVPLGRAFEPRDRKSTRLNSSHIPLSRMPSSA